MTCVSLHVSQSAWLSHPEAVQQCSLCGSGHYPGSSELVLPNLHRTCHPEIVLNALIILVAAGVWREFLGNPCLCQVHIWFPWREERTVVINFGNRKKRNAGICSSLLRFDHTLMQWRTEVTFRFLFYLWSIQKLKNKQTKNHSNNSNNNKTQTKISSS